MLQHLRVRPAIAGREGERERVTHPRSWTFAFSRANPYTQELRDLTESLFGLGCHLKVLADLLRK